jgi:hypothetical protein
MFLLGERTIPGASNMRTKMLASTVAVTFIAGITAISAAGQLSLTPQQKQTIQQDLSSQKAENMPSGFTLQRGTHVPQSVALHQLSSNLTNQIQSLKGDEFAKFNNNEIGIVNPSNRQVEAVINESSTTDSVMPSNKE